MNKPLTSSFRDPSGFVFNSNGEILRQVNNSYQKDYDSLMDSGLYKILTQKKKLIRHEEVTQAPVEVESCYKVIKPEQIKFISYPYEWSFSQLKDAALLTLSIQKIALSHGMTLKDASAYNIQFLNGNPILIDTLSFSTYKEGSPWVAYRQFCQHFLAPISLMSYLDISLNKLCQIYIDGIPLYIVSKLLPKMTFLNFGLLTHIHLHAKSQRNYLKENIKSNNPITKKTISINKNSLLGIVESLEVTIRKLKSKVDRIGWVDYYDSTNYSDISFEAKKKIVKEFLNEVKPKIIWDLGANIGIFSQISSEIKNSLTISTDYDPEAVEVNYLNCKKNRIENIVPLIVDLTNPSAAIGWNNEERDSFLHRGPVDLVLSLALIHHIAISNNVPLEKIAIFFSAICKSLIIEFIPKEDNQVQKLLISRDDIFHDYNLETFKNLFQKYFRIIKEISVTGSSRVLFLMEKI